MSELQALSMLIGELEALPVLEGFLSEVPTIYGELSDAISYKSYSGNYRISPLFGQDIKLQTENRVLSNNMVVKQIPYFETPTPDGGTTIYIGTEV